MESTSVCYHMSDKHPPKLFVLSGAGLQTEVLLPTSHNCNKICDILGLLNQNTGNFASSEKNAI